MTAIEALILGFIQGATEFLPISSSGHLVIAQQFLKIDGDLLSFDIFLHFATIIAVIIFFWKDLWKLRFKDLIVLGVASVPAVLVGIFFNDQIEALFSSLKTTGWEMLVSAGINFWAWYLLKKPVKNIHETVDVKTAGVMGAFQALSIVPAISRSGSTVLGGLLMGLQRETAFRFSFLMSIPVILGANALEVYKMAVEPVALPSVGVIMLGCLVAFIVGYSSLFVLRYMIAHAKLHWFGWYCLALGLGLIVFQNMR